MSKNNEVLISVIVPFYNRDNDLRNCIQSIEENISNNYEIIIVDDGSDEIFSNNAKNLLKNNILYFKIKKNLERGHARNYGALEAKGKYLNFFDSDDICKSNHINESIKFINKNNPEIFCNSYEVLGKKYKKKIFHNGLINNKIFEGNSISCNSVFIKKEIFLKYKFSENKNLSGSEDWDLWLRLANKYNFYGNKIITSTIIDHSDRSMRKQKISKIINRLNILEKRIYNNNIFDFDNYTRNIVISEILSFKSLSYSSEKKFKLFSLHYLFKSIIFNTKKIFLKRNLVILRNIFSY